jgi:hypothetical protein
MITSASTALNGNILLKDIKTRALVVAQPKADFVMQTVFYDEVREDEYLIEMKYSGICHTVRFLSKAPYQKSKTFAYSLLSRISCFNKDSSRAFVTIPQSSATKVPVLSKQSALKLTTKVLRSAIQCVFLL